MKKLLSVVLALVMVLSLTVPAFAGEQTMITEVNLTVGKTYTDLDTGVSVSVPDEADYTASYGGMEFVVGSDVYFYQITGGDANRWLKGYSLCETPPDVSNADKVFAVINLFTKDWQTYAFAQNDELTVTCNGRTINHKAQAASEEGWFLVSLSPQVHIDITPSKTSGSTTITATKAAPFSYEIVYPTTVPTITAAGVYEVGQAKVTNVVSATEDTVISYTATTTDFKCSGKSDLPATYHTDEAGQNAFPTTAVEVYKNKTDAEIIPTMYVGITEANWNAAENGTYKATVTFNFTAEEVTPVTAVDALTTGAEYKLNLTVGSDRFSFTYKKTDDGFAVVKKIKNEVDVTEDPTIISSSNASSGTDFAFSMADGQITVMLYASYNQYRIMDVMSQGVTFESFSVKPAGATEFTEVTLTTA